MNFYDLTFRTRNGELKSMSDFKGRAILIVNTATQCRFTNQYAPLQKLYEKYGSRGLAVLDFPCNQFLNQAFLKTSLSLMPIKP